MSKDVLVDFDELEKEAGEQLQFQAFTMPSLAQSQPAPSFFQPDPFQPGKQNEEIITPKEADQLGAAAETEVKPSIWTFAYYQRLFDVDTDQVLKRIVSSVVPTRGGSFYDNDIKRKPDLYGPFWICVTLVFSTAIAGNLYNYLMVAVSSTPWRYDFHKVPFAATAIFSYSWLLPLIIYGLLWWRKAQGDLSFLGLLCVYGYSLAIYIPVSLLWLIPVPWFQWTLVIVAAALSGSVLLLTLWPAVSGAEKRIAVIVMVAVLVFHMALAAGFLLYFFHVPTLPHPPTASPLVSVSSVAAETSKPVSKRSDNAAFIDDISNATLPKLTVSSLRDDASPKDVALQPSKSPKKMGIDNPAFVKENSTRTTLQSDTVEKIAKMPALVSNVTNNVTITSSLAAVKAR